MQNNTPANTIQITLPSAPSGPINYSSAAPYKEAATTATNQVANLTESGPSLLQALQKNLTGIFTNNNPLLNARESALTNYLSTPSQTRADLLPENLPVVAGSNLNLSPTQQNAIVQGREAAALTPLAGLNQAVVGMYGTIPQMVQNAGNIYQSLIGGATTRANLAQKQYEDIVSQAEKQNAARLQELQIALTAGGVQGRTNNVLAQVGADAKSGMNLNSIMAKYSTNSYVTPDDILRVYDVNSPYGGHKEDLQTLQRLYKVTPQGLGITADQANRMLAIAPAFNAIKSAKVTGFTGTGPQARLSQLALNFGISTGVPSNLVSLNSQFNLIRQEVLRAFQGGRISDKDYQQAQTYIPSITDDENLIKTKLANLESILGSGQLFGEQNSSSSSNNKDPLGLF